MWLNFHKEKSEHICQSMNIRKNWEKSDIIYEASIQEEGVNVINPIT